jgi:hypothetical protein
MATYVPGTNPPYPEQIVNITPTTVTNVTWLDASFPGLDPSNDHLQATADAAFQTTLVAGAAKKKIVVYEVAAMTTGGAADFTGTLAEEGATGDKVQFTGTQYGQARYTTPFELGEDKDLILYRCDGNSHASSSTAGDANILTVSYAVIDA